MISVNDLSDAGRLAYRAFLDMSDSKAAHFSCLEAIESTYESGGVPGIVEKLELEKLLANHDKHVLAFKTALAAVTDAAEREALIRMMS